MKSSTSLFLLLFLSILLISSCKADLPSGAEKYEQFLTDMSIQGKFNGNALILKNGKLVYQGAFGLRSIDPTDSLNLNSAFRLASVSKQFTAMAIMMLKEDKKLTYDQDIRQVFPELPYEGVTIRHLLNHTSGLPDYIVLLNKYWKPEFKQHDPRRFISGNEDIINMMIEKKPPIHFTPGEKFEYSNTGYVLLASIVKRISSQPFENFLKERIFDPVQMNNTSVYKYVLSPDLNMPNRVFGFRKTKDSGDLLSVDCNYLNFAQGDGGIFSTLNDLLKWDRALYENKLVSKLTLEEAFSPGILNNGKTTNYGFGWFIEESKDGKKTVSHSGGWVGFTTHIRREIDESNCIIILTNNTMGKGFGKMLNNLTKLLHEE